MHFIIDQGLPLMRVKSLIAATKTVVVFRNLPKRTSGLRMCVTLPLRMFSCVKGEHLIVLSPLDDVDSRHLEYLVSERALGWGKKAQEGFYQTDTVPPSGRFFKKAKVVSPQKQA